MGFLANFLERKVSTAEMDVILGRLEETIYYKELALYIAKSYIANTISKCEFLVYEDGKEVQNELYYALNVSPNPNQSSSQFLNKLIDILYDKNEALVIPRKGALYVADNFVIDQKPLKENIFSGVSVESVFINKTFKAGEVFYFKLDNVSVKQLVDKLYGTYSQLLACAIASYKRGNGQKYKLIMDNIKAGDKDFAALFESSIKNQLRTFIESDSAVYPQFRGTDLQTIGGSSGAKSDDVISLRKEVFDLVAQAFKIPNSMMYGNITNMQEIVKVYLTFCIDPVADMISEELTRKTNTFQTWNGGKNCVVVDTSRINHIDVLEVADKADKLIACGAGSIDEVRRVIGWRPLDTEFSRKHWVTKNYSDAEASMKEGVTE